MEQLKNVRKSTYQLNVCGCGVQYLLICVGVEENGNERVVDPGKCDDCLKKSIDKETQEIVNKANKSIANKEITKYDQYCEVPPGCEDATLENYEPENQSQEKALQAAKDFIAKLDVESNNSLMFQGTPGIGKSHLSVAIHKALRDQYIPTLIIDMPAFLQKLKSTFGYSDSAQAQEKLMRKIKEVDVLILDDIGAEYAKSDGNESWTSDILYQIMNDRQTKVNVFSTNYTSKDLKQKYGQLSTRIISRMLAGAEVVKVEGNDRRMKGFE